MENQPSKSLRILYVEDVASDVELVEYALKKGALNFSSKVVNNRDDYVKAISEFAPDVILSDYALPNFDGMTALRLRNELAPYVPFILVTGSINEETAVELTKTGVDDYVTKAHLLRLVPAIKGVVEKKNMENQNREAEKSLRQSELQFRLLAENARDVIYRYRFQPTPGFEYVSPSVTKVTGYAPQEFYDDVNLGYKMLHSEDRRKLLSLIKSGNPHPEPIVLRWVKKNGETIWAEQLYTPFFDEAGNVIAVDGIARDATERKRMENALQDEKEFSETAVNSLTGLFYVLDRNGRFVRWNNMFREMLGFSPERMRETFALDIFYEEDRDLISGKVEEVFNNGYAEIEARLKTRDGESPRHFFFTGKRIKIGNDEYLVGSGLDITERKILEDAIKNAASEWRSTFDSMPGMLMVLDNNSRILRVNRAMAELLELPFDKILGRVCWEVVHQTGLRAEFCPYKKDTGYDKKHTYEIYEKKLEKHFAVTTTPRFNDSGTQIGIIHVMTDITERKSLEEQLQQAQKMEAIGTLAGGIAHDFNNLLAVILGYSRSLFKELKEGDPIREDVAEIVEAGEKSVSLTRQLLTFSRKQALEPKVFNVNDVITNMNKMLRRIIGENIDLQTVLDPDLGYIKADLSQIEQVIMNLAINARDAMLEGGLLTVETDNVFFDDGYVGIHTSVEKGNYVRISVSDNGCGMDEETKQKIFDPFFTTKEIGKGTGLGLAIVYGIVKQSNGYILVYSEKEKGTTFKIYLPKIAEEKEIVEAKKYTMESLQGGETVLLVEDEDSVRKVIKRILKNAGYNVVEASSGQEAIELAQNNKCFIHLMLTDVVMPGISGGELAKLMAAMSPKTKTLYMSGYADSAVARHGFIDPGTPFIQKPFQPESLLIKIRELLDA